MYYFPFLLFAVIYFINLFLSACQNEFNFSEIGSADLSVDSIKLGRTSLGGIGYGGREVLW